MNFCGRFLRSEKFVTYIYISQASNYCDFHDLSRITKIDIHTFLELPVTISLSA